MAVLITGGAGFIGSHLSEKLLELGEEVYILDDLSTGNFKNIQHLMNNTKFRFVLGSVLDSSELLDSLMRSCRKVYHLAAAVGVKLVYEQPLDTIRRNVDGTAAVLASASKYNCKVLITSSSEVYGQDVKTMEGFKETDELVIGTSIRWCYASSKVLDEFLARAYFLQKGLPIIIVRLFNVVGPRQSAAYGMVVPRFINQALTGEPITVYGDGKQVRSFAWVGDVVDGIIKLMERKDLEGEVFNLGNDEPITIEELAIKVKQKVDNNLPIIYIPYEEIYGKGFEDIRFRVPNLTKIRQAIGYRASFNIDEILDKMIEFTRLQLRAG